MPQRQHGDYFSHSNCPRAQIFRRDLAAVRQLHQLQKLMRANDYRGDPLAHNNSEFQIAARFDLLDPASTNETASCGGAFDAKVNALPTSHPPRSPLSVFQRNPHAAAGHVAVAASEPHCTRRQRPDQRRSASVLLYPHPPLVAACACDRSQGHRLPPALATRTRACPTSGRSTGYRRSLCRKQVCGESVIHIVYT
jgi:hypothetical protein